MQLSTTRAGLLLLLAMPLLATKPADALAQLASALSRNDAIAALSVFDAKMPGYSTLENYIGALVSQTDILCAIEVLEEKENGPEKDLEVDWYMQLKSQSPSGPQERRHETVSIRMKLLRGNWKIIGISPVGILAPITF